MRVIYFDQYHHPEKASGLHLVDDLLDGMADRGWTVDLFVPTPTRGIDLETRREYIREKRTEKTRGGRVIIHRMSLMREGRNPLLRALRFIIFSTECFWKTLTRDYDVVFSSSGPPTQGFVLGIASSLRKKPFVFNLQDIFPDSLVTTGLAKQDSLVYRVGRVIENGAYKRASRIITVSDRMKKNILQKGASENKISVVMNWEDLSTVKRESQQDISLFEEYGISRDAFMVLYAGNLGASQNLESLVYLANDARDLDVQFVVFGEGTEEGRLKDLADSLGLSNISFYPLQPLDRVPEVYSMADVSYISCGQGVGSAGFPSKAWSIFAVGSPVLASFDMDSDLGDLIINNGLGLISEPGDRECLLANLIQMLNGKKGLAAAGKAARAFAEKEGNKTVSVPRYLDCIEAVFKEGR